MIREINITSKKIALTFAAVVLFLLFANLLIVYLRFVQDFKHLRGFIHGFYFDHEANFPSLYSSLAILFCSILLWRISSTPEEIARKRSRHWRFLSFIFLFLAIDEFGSLHEYLIQPVKAFVGQSSLQSDYLYFAWFIPYTILTLAIAILYLKFFFKLPLRTRWQFFFAALIFMSGAVVMEMIGGKYWSEQGWAIDGADPVDLAYALIVTLEELLEMTGIIVFVYALSSYYLAGRKEIYVFEISDDQGQSGEHNQTPSAISKPVQEGVHH